MNKKQNMLRVEPLRGRGFEARMSAGGPGFWVAGPGPATVEGSPSLRDAFLL